MLETHSPVLEAHARVARAYHIPIISLPAAIDAATATGDGFGGISLVPTAVTIDGDAATVTYDVIFGGNPAYSDLTGTIDLVDGTWVVPRSEFCSFMASARVGCEN